MKDNLLQLASRPTGKWTENLKIDHWSCYVFLAAGNICLENFYEVEITKDNTKGTKVILENHKRALKAFASNTFN